MENSVDITSSFNYSSFDSQSTGPLEIDLDRLPPPPPHKRNQNRYASPAPSVGSSPSLQSRIATAHRTSSSLGSNLGNSCTSKLIGNLEKMLSDNEWDYSDAEIVVDGIPVGVIRFVLASSSSFFHEYFQSWRFFKTWEITVYGKPRLYMSDLVPNGNIGYEAFLLILGYLYTGNLESYPPEVSTCIDDSCRHDACAPAIDFQVQLLHASATFQLEELVSSLQTNLLNIVDKAPVEDVMPILLVAFCCKLDVLLSRYVKRVAESRLDNLSIEKELPSEVHGAIKLHRAGYSQENASVRTADYLREMNIKRIYTALDYDSVRHAELFMRGTNITFNNAYCLHYAVTYCKPQVVNEILDLGMADVNLRNSRGYTVLHVAARRNNPSILIELLRRGARASDTTLDGQSAVLICRRATRHKDYVAHKKQGTAACIDILEEGMQINLASSTIAPLVDSIDFNEPFELENFKMNDIHGQELL